jgi:hypothetical protein
MALQPYFPANLAGGVSPFRHGDTRVPAGGRRKALISNGLRAGQLRRPKRSAEARILHHQRIVAAGCQFMR